VGADATREEVARDGGPHVSVEAVEKAFDHLGGLIVKAEICEGVLASGNDVFLHSTGTLLDDLLHHLVSEFVAHQGGNVGADAVEDLLLLGLGTAVENLLHFEGAGFVFAHLYHARLYPPPIEDLVLGFNRIQLVLQ